MLKVLFFSLSLLVLPNNKWAVTNLAVLLLALMMTGSLVNKCLISTPSDGLLMDPLRFSLVALSIWLTSLILIASTRVTRSQFKPAWFNRLVLTLMILLIITFSTSNVFIFYLIFESTLIPTLMLIIGWGYQPERIQAGVYILFYTLAASLPLLLLVFWLRDSMGTLNFVLMSVLPLPPLTAIMYLAIVGAFLVKIPIFIVHLWLPKAHVEAPVRGSIILAGVLLKLGGYGLLRMAPLFSSKFINFGLFWTTLSLVGGATTRFMCLRQTDTKSLVAYSSVAHISLVIGGIIVGRTTGSSGCLALIVAHGLCSSGIFCLTNIAFERVSSRSILICKGFLQIIPSIALWWFLLCICNIAAPPSINLLSEILLINRIMAWSLISLLPLIIISFMSAVFTLFLFAITQHGQFNSRIYGFNSGIINEYTLLLMHWAPLNLLILKADVFNLYFGSLNKILVCGAKDVVTQNNSIY